MLALDACISMAKNLNTQNADEGTTADMLAGARMAYVWHQTKEICWTTTNLPTCLQSVCKFEEGVCCQPTAGFEFDVSHITLLAYNPAC